MSAVRLGPVTRTTSPQAAGSAHRAQTAQGADIRTQAQKGLDDARAALAAAQAAYTWAEWRDWRRS